MSDDDLVSDIESYLPSLSREQRNRLKKQLNALEKLDPIEDAVADWLLDGFITELRKRQLWAGGLTAIQSSTAYKRFAKQSEAIRAHFEKKLNTTDKRKLLYTGEFLAGLLAKNLETWASVDIYTMFANVDRLPGLVNQSLPGYAQAGMLGIIIGRPLHA